MSGTLRILFIGQLWEGGTCLERLKILEKLGHKVLAVDTTPCLRAGNRILQSFAHRFNTGIPVALWNKTVTLAATTAGSADLVCIDKGVWAYPRTISLLKERTGGTIVHYTPDAQLVYNKSRHFRACIPLYDVAITTKPFEVDLYRAGGARKVLLALQGYDSRFAPMNLRAEDCSHFGSDVTFIGHCERHYSACLRAANRGGHKLRIWGPGWPRYALLHPWTKLPVEGNGVWGREYPIALGCSKIALGLLSKRFPETTTTRTFEIPAMGVFLLAERTEDHLQLFTEKVEAEYFGSETELQDKIRFYLRHDEARQKIARAGRERCIRSGYDAESQLRNLLTQIA